MNLANGTLNYSSYFGGSQLDSIKKMIVTAPGTVAFTGYTLSPDFPVTFGAYQTSFGGIANAYISVLNTNAQPLEGLNYSTYFGGSGGEVAYDLKQDSLGRLYFGGYTLSPNLPVTSNAMYASSVSGLIDGFVAILDPNQPLFSPKALVYSSYLTGTGTQSVYGVDVDTQGNIYVAGNTTANVFPNGTPPNNYVLKTSVFVLVFSLP